jgi:hypothetical protein
MPKEHKGRPCGSKNRPREALPLAEALRELESRTAQTAVMTAKILGTTEGAVRRDPTLHPFNMGRLVLFPSLVIRRRISPQGIEMQGVRNDH